MSQCPLPATVMAQPADPVVVTVPVVSRTGWVVLGGLIVILAFVAVYDIWALHTKRRTISQFMQGLGRTYRWFPWLAVLAIGLLTWHVLLGFPW